MTSTAEPDVTTSIDVALCGYGYWGANLARNLAASPTTRLVAVVEPDLGRHDEIQIRFPGVRLFTELNDALHGDVIDAVVIATPAASHAELALQVLRSGRHVLVEKPLATSAVDAQAIADEAARSGRVAMVGHTFLYSAAVEYLRQLIVDDGLGAIQYLYSQRLNLGRIRRDCNALWNFAPHDISIMMYLLDDRPTEVSGRGFSFIGEQEDVCFTSLEFGSGVGANIHVSWIDPRKTRLLTIVGDSQMVIYDDVEVDEKVRIIDAGVARAESFGSFSSMGDFQWRTRAGDITIPRIKQYEPLLREITEFGQSCIEQRRPRTDAAHGVDVVTVLEAIDASCRNGGASVEIQWAT